MTTSTKPRFRIRQAGLNDLPEAARTLALSWRESYVGLVPDEAIERHENGVEERGARWQQAACQGQYYWIVLDGERIVGVSTAVPARDADAPTGLELALFCLLDVARGCGVGDKLLQITIGDAPAYLWAAEADEDAMAFFRGHGFRPEGRRRDWAGTGQDQIMMVRA
ncbi:MAG: hypothetical protein Q3997_08425 [Propionibacteriaceae bacterium]|nr:hypothetical protein [Propionibacteriaceae bacterium]